MKVSIHLYINSVSEHLILQVPVFRQKISLCQNKRQKRRLSDIVIMNDVQEVQEILSFSKKNNAQLFLMLVKAELGWIFSS